MKQRLVAIILVFVILLGSAFAGPRSFLLHTAKADEGGFPNVLYWDTFKEYCRHFATGQDLTHLNQVFDYADTHFNDSSFNIFVLYDPDGNVGFTIVEYGQNSDKNGWYLNSFGNPVNEFQLRTRSDTSGLLKVRGFFSLVNSQVNFCNTMNQALTIVARRSALYISTWTQGQLDRFYPTPFEWDNPTFKWYCLHSITGVKSSEYNYSGNIVAGAAPTPTPTVIPYNLVTFNLGDRKFLSVDKQEELFISDSHDESPQFYIWNNSLMNLIEYNLNDFTIIPSGEAYIDVNWIHYDGYDASDPPDVFAIDISGLEWTSIDNSYMMYSVSSGPSQEVYAEAFNVPYVLYQNDASTDPYTEAVTNFYNYVTNYNTNQVVPQTLDGTLYGLNGSKVYPASVWIPVEVFNGVVRGPNDGTAFYNNHVWQWWLEGVSNLGINFELMDVVIIPPSFSGSYSLCYYYDASLAVPFKPIYTTSLADLIENFDVIIFLPDDHDTLQGDVGFWDALWNNVLHALDIDFANSSYPMAMSGSSSNGVLYDSSIPSDLPEGRTGVLTGYCVVTKKCLQRQQLFVFNDGFTKSYKLMSDYFDKWGLWQNSFLDFTLSFFEQFQSLWGKLDGIYNLLFNLHLDNRLDSITTALERIGENTSEKQNNYWFFSLFRWVNRFHITNFNFIDWVNNYDDFESDVPDPGSVTPLITPYIPVVSPTVVPLPTITAAAG